LDNKLSNAQKFIQVIKSSLTSFLPYIFCRVKVYFPLKIASIFGLMFGQQQENAENLKKSKRKFMDLDNELKFIKIKIS